MTIKDILKMGVEQRRKDTRFNATELGNDITVVDIDGNKFTDYSAFSFIWEKSYVKSPERSADGSIGNLNSYPTFVTPHLKIDFSLLDIESYRRLMQLVYEKNEFLVTCYDIVYNRMTTNKMYFSTEEMPKLLAIARVLNGESWVELLGVQDYVVEMVGTNVSLEEVDILYYDDKGNLIAEATQTVHKGVDAEINYEFVPSAGYRFEGEWEKATGEVVRNGDVILVNSEIKLYAKVVPTNQYTISLNYGIGIKPQPQNSEDNVNSFEIIVGETIGTAITKANITLADGTVFKFPSNGTGVKKVEYNGKEYDNAYYFAGWSWDVASAEGNLHVSEDTKYNYEFNRTIYQHFKTNPHSLNYNTGVANLYLGSIMAGYGEKVPTPTLFDGDKMSKGWYWKDGDKEVAFNGTMPPFNITIYAKWE